DGAVLVFIFRHERRKRFKVIVLILRPPIEDGQLVRDILCIFKIESVLDWAQRMEGIELGEQARQRILFCSRPHSHNSSFHLFMSYSRCVKILSTNARG